MKDIPISLLCSLLLTLLRADVGTVFAQTPTTPKIVFTSWRDGSTEIYTMNPDGSDQVNLTQHFSKNRDPVWSPSGEQIMFTSNRDGVSDLYLMDPDGKNAKRVFEKVDHRQSPTWHPNGKRFAYLDYGEWVLYIADIDGQNVKRIAPTGKLGGDPAWSPDGTEIAFVFAEPRSYRIRIINLETGAHRTLAHPEPDLRMRDPAWSPEGDRIAYASLPLFEDEWDQGTIYFVNPDGSGLRQIIAKDGPRADDPTWSPHGDEILYEQEIDGENQIFIFHLSHRVTTQLTHKSSHFQSDWFDPAALPVTLQPELLTTWGKIKQK